MDLYFLSHPEAVDLYFLSHPEAVDLYFRLKMYIFDFIWVQIRSSPNDYSQANVQIDRRTGQRNRQPMLRERRA